MHPREKNSVEFLTLGAIELWDHRGTGSELVDIPPKSRALLAYLALARPRDGFHARDTLATLFWPDHDQEHARSNLRKAVYDLRRLIGAETLVTQGKEQLRLDRERFQCDAVVLEEGLDGDDPGVAIDLYRGELLPGMHLADSAEFERWLEEERGAVEERVRGAIRKMAESAEANGKLAEAARWHRRALEIEPYDEATLRRLMELRAKLGDRAGAIKAYEAFVRRLGEDLELEPTEQTQEVAEAVRTAEASAERPPSAPRSMREPSREGPSPTPVTIHTVEQHTVEKPTALLASWPRWARIAVVYSIAALITILLVATAVEAFNWPVWMTRATILLMVLGLPVVPTVEWLLNQKRSGKPDSAVGGFKHTREVVAALIVVATIGAGWGVWKRWSFGPPDLSPTSFAVLPFNVRGSAEIEYLSEGMASLLSKKISGVGDFDAVDSNAILKRIREFRIQEPDPESGARVAEHFGAGVFILGNVVEVGDQLHIDASIYESDRAGPYSTVSVQGSSGDLMSLVDRLAGQLLAARLDDNGGTLTTLAAMTTDSLDALRAYLEGEQELYAGRAPTAVERFQDAVTIDPRFALAHYRLGIAASWISEYGIVEEAAENAYQHRDRLSPRDRVLIEAFYAHEKGRYATVRDLLRRHLDKHPEDAEAWYVYGEALFHGNEFRGRSITEAAEPLERAVVVYPELRKVLASHLMAISAVRGDYAGVGSLLQRVDPDRQNELDWWAVLAFAQGSAQDQRDVLLELEQGSEGMLRAAANRVLVHAPRSRGAERVLRLLLAPERPIYSQRLGRLLLATLSFQDGRWNAGISQIDSMRLLDPSRAARAFEIEALFAAVEFYAVPDSEVTEIRQALIDWNPTEVGEWVEPGVPPLGFEPLYRHYLIGLLDLRLGNDPTTSLRQLRRWRDTNGGETDSLGILSDFLTGQLEGHIARDAGDLDDALERFSNSAPGVTSGEIVNSPILSQPYAFFARGEVHLTTGDLDRAKGWFTVFTEGTTWLHVPFRPMAHYRLAQIYEKEGALEQAATHYSVFIDYWAEADDRLQPVVSDARTRLQDVTAKAAGD